MLDNTMVVTTREALVAIILSVVIVDASIISAKAINTYHYYEIDFTYTNVINGNSYIEEATLLRDNQWLEENNIHKTGDTLVLNIPEFGVVNAKATAKEVKATNFNPESFYTNNQSMVTGTFKHYSVDVREYTLQDSKTGITQDIQATPNHAFYVQNRTAFNKALNEQSHFIEIQNITPKDYMLNEAGNSVKLVCKQNQITINQDNGKVYNCYKQLVTNNKPIAVYNLEIYKQHQYLVLSNNNNSTNNSTPLILSFNNAILVHNVCGCISRLCGGSSVTEPDIELGSATHSADNLGYNASVSVISEIENNESFDEIYANIRNSSNHYKAIGSGQFGDVYEYNNKWVYKKSKVDDYYKLKVESKKFNKYHGEDASRAYNYIPELRSGMFVEQDETQGILIMKKIPGDKMTPNSIPEDFDAMFNSMQRELNSKGIEHRDLVFNEQNEPKSLTIIKNNWYNLGNFLYDNNNKIFNPIDFGIANFLN